MTELLPCPFCGGEVQLVHRDAEPKNSECECIDTDECEDCWECGWFDEYWYIRHRCETRYWTFDFDSDYCDTEAEAIAAWNTRAATTIGKVHVEVAPTVRTCKPVEKDGVMHCPECDYPLGIMSVPAFCAGCGAKVVEQ